MSVVSVAFGSAVVTGDFGGIEKEFGVGEVVTALSVSLMVVGFGSVFSFFDSFLLLTCASGLVP